MKHRSRNLWRRLPVTTILALVTTLAHAQINNTNTPTLPWEAPLTNLAGSLTGPVAKAIGVIALAVAGGMLAFGGELAEFTKRILMVVLALAVMLLAGGFITQLGMP